MDRRIGAAKRRFPEYAPAIDLLVSRDEEFRSLCMDLADAEAAAAEWGLSASPKSRERQNEYLILASDLADEIGRELDKVVILGARPERARDKQ